MAELHDAAIINSLSFSGDSRIGSIAPGRIETDRLVFEPIFDVDFGEVSELFRYSGDVVFEHYGSSRRMLPGEVREYVLGKERQWEAGEWFEYVVRYAGELIGKAYLNASSGLDSFEFGFWLQERYWGQRFSQERADAFMHICFEELDASFIDVGTVIQNVKSRRSIEKYIGRYGGSFYGCVPRSDGVYHRPDDPTTVVKHPEWCVTQADYRSGESGVSCLVPGVEYSDVEFPD